MTQHYESAQSYVMALAGDPEAVFEWRAIHDTNKQVPAIPMRGTLSQVWQALVSWNDEGYGIFATPAAMDGQGRELGNVSYIRAHYVDLDDLDAQQQYERAAAAHPAPGFAVQSSPRKFHVYWPVQP